MSEPHEPKMTGTKTCCHCDRDLPVLFFSVHKAAADGLSSWCRECHSTARRDQYAELRRTRDLKDRRKLTLKYPFGLD